MKRKIYLTALVSICLSLAQAHEFWMQPKKFRFALGEEMKVDLMEGDNFGGEFWDFNSYKAEKMEVYGGGAVKNILKDLKSSAGNNLVYKFDKPGTHLLSLESNNAFAEHEAKAFNNYLEENGIEDILDGRTNAKELNKAVRESYKCFAKLLVQSGNLTDEAYRRRSGFRFEIIPLSNPYTLRVGDYLECRVLWSGAVAPHSLIKVWSHISGRIFLQNIYTENDGTIKFPISSTGPWMISAVKMVPAEMAGADYQSFRTSLVFGIEEKK